MCREIYLGSEKELPEIEWNEENPGFYLLRENLKPSEFLESVLKLPYIYKALSFMGCGCGLCYAEWLEDDDKRKKDVNDFMRYLDEHKVNNNLRIFSTSWDEFPDVYELIEFRTTDIDNEEFYMEENVVLVVI